MAHIFQCDCCGQREPEVISYTTLVVSFDNERRDFDVCLECKGKIAKELGLFYRRIQEHKYGNT